MPDATCNVPSLRTGNSAGSNLGEAVMNKLCSGRFKAFSAGSQPSGELQLSCIDEYAMKQQLLEIGRTEDASMGASA